MYIELKADDVMPFGKHIGTTLREVYKLDANYFRQLCSQTNDYIISSRTQEIITKSLEEIEKSKPSYSKAAQKRRHELKPDDHVSGGPFNGKTLYEIFSKNESYYRYLCENRYFVSKSTFDEMQNRQAASLSSKKDLHVTIVAGGRLLQTNRFRIPYSLELKMRSSSDAKTDKMYRRLRYLEGIEPPPQNFSFYWSDSIEKILTDDAEYKKVVSRLNDLQTKLDISELDANGFFNILLCADQVYQQIDAHYALLSTSTYLPFISACPELKSHLLLQNSLDFKKTFKRLKRLAEKEWCITNAQNISLSVALALLSPSDTDHAKRRKIARFIGQGLETFEMIKKLLHAANFELSDILSRIDSLQKAIDLGEIKKPSAQILCEVLFNQTNEEFDSWMTCARLSKNRPVEYEYRSKKQQSNSLNLCAGNCSTCNRTPCPFS